ncbi:MAG: hypothetical protein ACPGWR_13110 [Ardenticatenaceae bacterium]
MVSALNWRTWLQRKPKGGPKIAVTQKASGASWKFHLFGMLLFSLPFLLLGYISHRLLFVSNIHAQTITKVLLGLEEGKLEIIGFAYPPLPSLITAFYPKPITLMIATALASGALMWVLWDHLRDTRLPLSSRFLLLLGLAVVPSTAFLITQSLNESASLLLFLLSWRSFIEFTRENNTQHGFISGLILSVAFYFSVYALVYALMYAVLAPFFYEWPADLPNEKRLPAALTGMAVIAFPTLIGFVGWTYLNWLFTGDVWYLFKDPLSPVYSYLQSEQVYRVGWEAAISQTWSDLARSPIYLVVGLITAFHATRRLPAYILLVMLITAVRATGFNYPEAFALGSYLVLGIMAIPRNVSPSWGPVLMLAVLVHVLVGHLGIDVTPEIKQWQEMVKSGSSLKADQWEVSVAERLALAPAGSILADDHSAYRLIMRAGTTRPFLLPYDTTWEEALHDPPQEILYILVATDQPGFRDRLAQRSLFALPPGFIVEANWPGWTLYRRGTAERLLTKQSN